MFRPALSLTMLLSIAASLSCGDDQPYLGVWVHEELGVERVAYGFGFVEVETAERDAEGDLLRHWTGIHDLQGTGELFEGKITWQWRYDTETQEWEEWDSPIEEEVRVEVIGDFLAFSTREPPEEWAEADYSPLIRRA